MTISSARKKLQSSRSWNSLIRSSLIRSFAHFAQIKWATVSDSLRSLKTNERPWANRSGRSEEMSDVSESLISLTKNERPWAIRSGRSEEMSESLISLRGNEQMSDSLKKKFL